MPTPDPTASMSDRFPAELVRLTYEWVLSDNFSHDHEEPLPPKELVTFFTERMCDIDYPDGDYPLRLRSLAKRIVKPMVHYKHAHVHLEPQALATLLEFVFDAVHHWKFVDPQHPGEDDHYEQFRTSLGVILQEGGAQVILCEHCRHSI